jgi:hypothetical protein
MNDYKWNSFITFFHTMKNFTWFWLDLDLMIHRIKSYTQIWEANPICPSPSADSGCQYLEHNEKPVFQTGTGTWTAIQCSWTGKLTKRTTSGPQWPITHQWENVKSTQEIECRQYKCTTAILSPSLPFAPFYFLKQIGWYPGTFCTHNLSCYECSERHITCSVTCHIPLIPITCPKHT